MRYPILATGILLSLTASASAWEVRQDRDRLTEKTVTWAEVAAKPEPGRDFEGKVLILCSFELRRNIIDLRLTPKLAPGRLGFRYVVDKRQQKVRLDIVGANGGPIFFINDPDELRGATVLKVELHPAKLSPVFLEFDVSGYEKALASVPCR